MAANAFTRDVVKQMQTLFPEELADKSWDNVGLLLENSKVGQATPVRYRVLLTNDLTPDVVEEAIAYQVSIVIAYHPFIFRGLKSITLRDPQQASLLRLAQNNIAVYCPHTALDAGVEGINDWLASCVTEAARRLGCTNTSTVVVQSNLDKLPKEKHVLDSEGEVLDVGYGRITSLHRPVAADDMIREVLVSMGLSMSHVLVARPRNSSGLEYRWNDLTSVGVCAGSGFDIFRSQLHKISMLVTGEVSHHDALYATTQGVWVVCLLHSNSERRFLSAKLQPQLTEALEKNTSHNATVLVSQCDRDPFEIWDVKNPPAKPKDTPESFTV